MDPMTMMAVGSLALGFLGQRGAADAAKTEARYRYDAAMEGFDLRREAMGLQHQQFLMGLGAGMLANQQNYRLSLRTLESDYSLRLREIESNEKIALAQTRNEALALQNESNTVSSDILYGGDERFG